VGDEAGWLARVVRTIRGDHDDDSWVAAFTYDAKKPDLPRASALCGIDARAASIALRQLFAPVWSYSSRAQLWRMNFIGTLSSFPAAYRRLGVDETCVREFEALLESVLAQWRLGDELWVNASDPTGMGCCIIASMRRRGPIGSREKHRWSCVAAHVATAFRIRRQFSLRGPTSSAGTTPAPEAILDPDCSVQHAERPAADGRARASLRQAVQAMDRARGALRRRNADEAVATWRALVSGRWSLLDHFDSDGRRFVIAHRNDAKVPDERALTLRERQVLAYAGLGHSNKVIAYELGLSTSTVSSHLTRARAKLRLASWGALSA
jgi:DNA-binding CsgD family transcriptional regulator